MKDHVNLPLSIGECRRVLGKDAVKEILGEGGLPQEYAGGIAMPHLLRQMLVAWVKANRPDPVNTETEQTSRYVTESRGKWAELDKAKRQLTELWGDLGTAQKELEKLRAHAEDYDQMKRDMRITDRLYGDKKKQYVEQKRLADIYNSRLILYRGRYGDRFMGELNWLQRFVARLFFITGKRSK